MTDNATIHALAADVAAELTELTRQAWSAEVPDPDWRLTYLAGPDGQRLTLSPTWRDPERVEIGSAYPREAHDVVYPSLARVEATVALRRGAKVLAREIVRRVLPQYRTELERAQHALDRSAKAQQARTRLAEEMAAVVGGTVPAHRQRDTRTVVEFGRYGEGPRGTVETDYAGTSVKLEIDDVSPELARKLLDVLAVAR